MKIHIIAAALPPQLDGIGDYTANLSAELARLAQVKILTAQHDAAPIAGVAVETVFSAMQPRSVWRIAERVQAERPDWLLLQYNPFSYGRWGWNPHLPMMMRSIKRSGTGTRLALMVHEPFTPGNTLKSLPMTVWQRWQLWMLGRNADVIFFSIDPWARRFASWFGARPMVHLPVGSNIARIGITKCEARARLGIADGTCVLGFFGTARAIKMLEWTREAVAAIRRDDGETLLSYMGPHPHIVRDVFGPVPLLAEGPLDAAEVSRRLAAVDIYLAPFVDGVSTRRTSFMTGLQHGLAVVGTRGELTDDLLAKQNERAFLLADVTAPDAFQAQVLRVHGDETLRHTLGWAAQQLYEQEFAWERIGTKMLATLENLC